MAKMLISVRRPLEWNLRRQHIEKLYYSIRRLPLIEIVYWYSSLVAQIERWMHLPQLHQWVKGICHQGPIVGVSDLILTRAKQLDSVFSSDSNGTSKSTSAITNLKIDAFWWNLCSSTRLTNPPTTDPVALQTQGYCKFTCWSNVPSSCS